jgi:hypothetical protein
MEHDDSNRDEKRAKSRDAQKLQEDSSVAGLLTESV